MTDNAEVALIRGLHYLAESQSTVAHNLANISSSGFKRRVPVASAVGSPYNEVRPGEVPSTSFSDALDWRLGSINVTGNTTHMAIKNSSQFLKVAAGDGSQFYARPSTLAVNKDTYLVTNTGHRVLDDKGLPIQLQNEKGEPVSIGQMRISPAGLISNGDVNNIVATLGIYEVPEPARLTAQPGGLFDYGGAPARLTRTNDIVQGAQEQSNVDATLELINMIMVQRGYQADMQALTTLGRIKDSYVTAFNN